MTHSPSPTTRRERLGLLALVVGGLATRLAFLFWGSRVYYGPGQARFTTKDTPSYAQSFLNLLDLGRYTFDPAIPDASFGRLPGYPFFWGIHALVFGREHAYLAVAVTQVLLDALGVWLLWAVVRRSGSSRSGPWIGGTVLAFYPFTVVWTTISGTEAFGVFLCLFFLFLLSRPYTRGYAAAVGAVAGIAFLTRPYLLTLLPAALVCWWLESVRGRALLRRGGLLATAFLVVYLPWPVRNLVNHHRLVLVKPASAGYVHFSPDFAAFRSWVYAWQPGLQPYHQQIIDGDEPLRFPPSIFVDAQEAAQARELVARARSCGTGFRAWRGLPAAAQPCDQDVARGFDALRRSYVRAHPLRTWVGVPALNLRKAVFKSDLEEPRDSRSLMGQAVRAMFALRSLLVLLGLAGLWVFRRTPLVGAAATVSLPIYLAFAAVFRQIEMRYLLQADVALLLPAALVLGLAGDVLLRRWARGPALSERGANSPT